MIVNKNLLQETKNALLRYEKTPEDVLWVGNYEQWETWENFEKSADFEYDSSDSIVIDTTLFIVGDNWWLERDGYDDSEWWEFKTLPTRPEEEVSYLDLKR